MLYANDYPVDEGHVFIQVHVPRSGGTTLRHQLQKVFGLSQCLMNYKAEIEYLTDAELSNFRLISGHFSYGMHHYFFRQPLYITTMREPVARFVSLYSAYLVTPQNRHHKIANKYDINQFLRYCLQCDDPELSQQVRNLQCRFVCGNEDFSLARAYIDERYFLACPFNQSEVLVGMLCKLLGIGPPALLIPNATQGKMGAYKERMNLTEDSIALLLEHNKQDLQLYHYVQRAFTLIQDSANPVIDNHVPGATRFFSSNVVTSASKVETRQLSKLHQLMSNVSKRFLLCLPLALMYNMRVLWVGPHDSVILPHGVNFEVVADFEEACQRKIGDAYFDLILVALPFEALVNDILIFNKLFQRMSTDGILQICCLNPQRLLDWPDEYPGFSPIRTYQNDVLSRFEIVNKKLFHLVFQEKFPLTGSRCQGYLFFKNAQYLALIQQCLSTLRLTLSINGVYP